MPFCFSDSLHIYLLVAIILFLMGIFGMIYRRSFIGMLISVELILNGAALNFMAF
ncbi:MAG: NADH-quinone oxidoreductase subunit K, partial [Desulfosarcina sp.]|nr:NADH-quinone oxidoreductase subunit K [Desulfobacterales bacterium]